MTSVQDFNRLPDHAAEQALQACCACTRWVAAVAARRPYISLGAVLAESDAAVAVLNESDLHEALGGHPRIGGQRDAVGRSPSPEGGPAPSGWSEQEQAGVSGADAKVLQALADGNAEYERRFGHIYLACATGRTAAELLAFLRERLGNDRGTEWRVVAAELAKINQIRLRKLIGGSAGGGSAGGGSAVGGTA